MRPLLAPLLAPLLVPLLAASAHAAGAAGNAAPADPEQAPQSVAAPLPEILVTADKRTESLQLTPAAITAIAGDALSAAGATDIRGVEDLVPSVRFQQENAATEIYIRGVGSTLDFPQIASPNVFNLNGVSVPREATSVPLYDVAQLEVLPGPQGTLYGSSALGGAVNVNFRRPSMDYETHALVEAGDYALWHLSVADNLPISPSLAVRLAADELSHGGYETSGADSQRDLGARLSALFAPSDNLSALIWGSGVWKDGHPPNLVPLGVNPRSGKLEPGSYLSSNPWNDQFPPPYSQALPFGQPRAEQQGYFNRMWGGQIDLTFAGGPKLTWIPSYLGVATAPDYWLGAFPGQETDNYRQTTNELRAAATESWGSWIAGLYAYDLDGNGTFLFGGFSPTTGFPVSIVTLDRIEGEAAFGELKFNLARDVHLTVGGRFSADDRVGGGRYESRAGLAPYSYGRDFHHVDDKLAIDYEPTAQTMLYAATQTGYQPGTFNAYASTPTVSNAVQQATLTAFTAGAKNRLLGGRVQINDELFYYAYHGLFASAYNTVLNSTQTFNAQRTEIFGDQLDILSQITAADRVDVSVGYLDARNIRFELPDGAANYDGYQLQYAPDWTVNGSYTHDFRLADGSLRLRLAGRYEDSFYADFSHTPGGRQQPYVKSDASLGYFAANGRWSVGAWVRNIGNVAVIAATAGGSNIPALATGATAFLEPPRTYGLRATWKYY